MTPWPAVRRVLWMAVTIATGAYAPMVAIHALCLVGVGWGIPGVEFFVAVPMGGLAVAMLAIPCMAWRRLRTRAVAAAAVSLLVAAAIVPALMAASALRTAGFNRAARRAAPLVDALERYTRDSGSPPVSLEDLVPRYLSAVPAGLPDLKLVTGPDAAYYAGNPWVLVASTPTGVVNFDQFMYFPNQRYPQRGYGGTIERIDRWAYVHE